MPTTKAPVQDPWSLWITLNVIDNITCPLGLPSPLEARRARSGSQPRRTWGQAHELCSDRAFRRPAVARCAVPPRAAPMSFPAFRCLHPKRAVALLGHKFHLTIKQTLRPRLRRQKPEPTTILLLRLGNAYAEARHTRPAWCLHQPPVPPCLRLVVPPAPAPSGPGGFWLEVARQMAPGGLWLYSNAYAMSKTKMQPQLNTSAASDSPPAKNGRLGPLLG